MKLVPISKEELQKETVNGLSKLYLVKTKGVDGQPGHIFASVMHETYDRVPTGSRWFSHPRLLWASVEDIDEIYIIDDTLG